MNIDTDADLDALAKMIDSTWQKPKPPPNLKVNTGEMISVLDSGSVVTGARADKVFPEHPVEPSEGQKKGVAYVAADGGVMLNKGQVRAKVRTPDGQELPDVP